MENMKKNEALLEATSGLRRKEFLKKKKEERASMRGRREELRQKYARAPGSSS